MHDPRIGRFFAIDPLASKYPHNSPYAFSENSTIAFVELEGLERISFTLKFDKDGKPVFRKFKTKENGTFEFGVVITITANGKKYIIKGEPEFLDRWTNSRSNFHKWKNGDFYLREGFIDNDHPGELKLVPVTMEGFERAFRSTDGDNDASDEFTSSLLTASLFAATMELSNMAAVNVFAVRNARSYYHNAQTRSGKNTPKKVTWKEHGYKYEVRTHPAEEKYGKSGDIFRVSRQKRGEGKEYIDEDGVWHHESTLKPGGKRGGQPNANYNEEAAKSTHIEVKKNGDN